MNKYNYYFYHAKKICSKCYNYKFCGSCIFHFNNIDKIEYVDESSCDYFQDQQSYKESLYLNFSFLEKYPNDLYYIVENVN